MSSGPKREDMSSGPKREENQDLMMMHRRKDHDDDDDDDDHDDDDGDDDGVVRPLGHRHAIMMIITDTRCDDDGVGHAINGPVKTLGHSHAVMVRSGLLSTDTNTTYTLARAKSKNDKQWHPGTRLTASP